MSIGFPYLLSLLSRLKEARIQHTLEHNQDHSILVLAHTPDERWEIEIFGDGSAAVHIFKRDPVTYGVEKLEELFPSESN